MSLFASLAAALRSPRVRSRRAGGDLVWGTLLLLGIAAVFLAGGLRPLDDAFAGFRFNIADRAPSQTLTVVEIDSRSLRAAGAWPWDRSRYAQAVETLVDAGATVVALDVDFSSASNPASDRAFAEAISRHPGQVALANFVQKDTYGVRHSGVVENTPLPAFRRDALLASVNVPVDRDGKVREYDVSPQLSTHPSVAALLAGSQAGPASFDIDFGIDPAPSATSALRM
jgi:CHASE2 domain-containing sensor protein